MQRNIHRVIDAIADFCGTPLFLLLNITFDTGWILLNTITPKWMHIDPYPFIFFVLLLSLQAIYMSNFILISQNRQGERDRKRAEADHQLNINESRQEREILTILDKQNEEIAALKQLLQASKRPTRKSSARTADML